MISSITVPADGKIRNLQVKAKTSIKFSNNISALNVVSSLDEAHIDRSKLKSINLGSNVKVLGQSCFERCINLSSVTGGSNVHSIDDYAFKDCTALTGFSPLSPAGSRKLAIKNIGVSAFANTGIRSIAIGLSSGSTASTIQSYAFAGCKQLTSFTNLVRNALADYQFDGCTALKNVQLADQHDFCGSYVFQNCTALERISIPPKTYFIGDGFCKGCTSLTSFVFEEPAGQKALLAGANAVGNDFLSGTAVASLTFPSSVTNFAMLSKNALRGMSQLKELHFTGMSINDIVEHNSSTTTLEYKYQFNKIYSCISKNSVMECGYNMVNDAYPYDSIFIDTDASTCKTIANYCLQANIPLIVFSGNKNASSCGNCRRFIQHVLSNPTFLNWLTSDKNKAIILDVDGNDDIDDLMLQKIAGKYESYSYEAVFGYYNGRSLKLTSVYAESETDYARHSTLSDRYQSASSLIAKFESLAEGFEAPNEASEIVNSDIISTKCFGLNHDVTIIAKDGSAKISIDPSSDEMHFDYETQVHVDAITKDDFRYGQWYYNAIELRKYADEHHIPVFAEYSSKNCGPCEDFGQTVFNRPEFQSLVTSKNILLCRVEATSKANVEAQYLADVWITEKPGAVMPLLMAYYNDGEKIYRAYAHYNQQESNTYYTGSNANAQLSTDLAHYWPWLSSYQDVYDWVQKYCVNGSECPIKYTAEPQFMLPSIQSISSYPRYNYYAVQPNDTYGRYFPVVSLLSVVPGYQYDISVDNGSGTRTAYSITYPMPTGRPLPPEGTYQCFTTQNDSEYSTFYDAYGIMFQVASDIVKVLQTSASYAMGQRTIDQFLDGRFTIAQNVQSSMNYDAYLQDTDGDITLSIDTSENIYNAKLTCRFDPSIIIGGVEVDAAEMLLCAEPQLKAYDPGDPESMHYIELTGEPYVLSGMLYSISGQSAPVLKWLSSFTNYTNE